MIARVFSFGFGVWHLLALIAGSLFLNPALLGLPLWSHQTPSASLVAVFIGVIQGLITTTLLERFFDWLPQLHSVYTTPAIHVSPATVRVVRIVAFPISLACASLSIGVFALFAPMGYGVALAAQFVAMWLIITVVMGFLHLISKLSSKKKV